MKTILLLLFFIGAFLVMDASHREALKTAVRDAEARGRGGTRYRLPRSDEIVDLQFSLRAQEFGSIFDSSGPWAYRSDVAAPKEAKKDAADTQDGAKPDKAKPAPAVEGFSGTGGGKPSFLDSLGSPTHPPDAGAGSVMRSALAGLPEMDWSSTRFGRANRAASTSDYSRAAADRENFS